MWLRSGELEPALVQTALQEGRGGGGAVGGGGGSKRREECEGVGCKQLACKQLAMKCMTGCDCIILY